MINRHRIAFYLYIWGTEMPAIFYLKCVSETAGIRALRFETVLLKDETSSELLWTQTASFSVYTGIVLCSVFVLSSELAG